VWYCRVIESPADHRLFSMAQIPLIRLSNLVHCTICASVEEGIEVGKRMILRIGAGTGVQFVLVGKHPHGTFLHVEMAVPQWFDGSPPKRSGQRRSLDKLVDDNNGKKCEIRVAGTFRVPVASLPENGFVVTSSKTMSSGGASMRLVGAELKISGTPFQRLRWSFVDETEGNGLVDVTLRGRLKGTISDAYLEDAIAFLSRGFATFVTGAKND
jgi:hypothetical protein